MLSAFIWTVGFLMPKAVRAHDMFGVFCSALAALVALITWLLIGTVAHSHGNKPSRYTFRDEAYRRFTSGGTGVRGQTGLASSMRHSGPPR